MTWIDIYQKWAICIKKLCLLLCRLPKKKYLCTRNSEMRLLTTRFPLHP